MPDIEPILREDILLRGSNKSKHESWRDNVRGSMAAMVWGVCVVVMVL